MARNGGSGSKGARGKGSAPKAERKKSTKPKADKPSVEKMSDQQRQALLMQHKRKLVPLLAAKKQATDAVSKAYELAKKEGVTKRELDLSIAMMNGEGIDKVKKDIEIIGRIARWSGVGHQLEMFTSKETQTQRHFEDGRRAALDNQPPRAPTHLSQKDVQTWLEGHAAGRNTLNTIRAEGFKPLGGVAAGVAEQAGEVGEKFGVVPSTHVEEGGEAARH